MMETFDSFWRMAQVVLGIGLVIFAHESGHFLAARLCTWHNLHYYLRLVKGARAAIQAGTFESWRRDFHTGYQRGPKDT